MQFKNLKIGDRFFCAKYGTCTKISERAVETEPYTTKDYKGDSIQYSREILNIKRVNMSVVKK